MQNDQQAWVNKMGLSKSIVKENLGRSYYLQAVTFN